MYPSPYLSPQPTQNLRIIEWLSVEEKYLIIYYEQSRAKLTLRKSKQTTICKGHKIYIFEDRQNTSLCVLTKKWGKLAHDAVNVYCTYKCSWRIDILQGRVVEAVRFWIKFYSDANLRI